MNKKVALILAIAISLIGIVFVSTFGLIPESLRIKIKMEKLYFDITPTMNSVTNEQEKTIEMNFKANNNTINLYEYVCILPLDTTDISLQYSTDQATQKIAVSSTGLLTIYDLTIKSFEVTVKSLDGSELKDKLIVRKPSENQQDFGDEWEWG